MVSFVQLGGWVGDTSGYFFRKPQSHGYCYLNSMVQPHIIHELSLQSMYISHTYTFASWTVELSVKLVIYFS